MDLSYEIRQLLELFVIHGVCVCGRTLYEIGNSVVLTQQRDDSLIPDEETEDCHTQIRIGLLCVVPNMKKLSSQFLETLL